MKPKVNLWIEVDGEVALSSWRVNLLELVDRLGSISAAAVELEVPYRRAWQKVREMEDRLGAALLETSVGGQSGGGARLTPAGRRYIEKFRQFSEGIEVDVAERYRAAFGSK